MRHTKLLAVILLFAAFLYLYKLNSNPPGMFADEATTGYNIYSLLLTAKDEYGKFLPLGFRQMGSYTPPLYIYFSVPFVALFGLSAFSTRLLSVFCGLATVSIIFYLLQEFKISKSKTSLFFTTLFAAITPWLIFFSRMGYEQALALFIFSLSILLFTKSLKNSKLLLLTISITSLATYADFPQRYLMPLIFVVFAYSFRKSFDFAKNIRPIIVGVVIAAVIQIPNLYLATTNSFYTKNSHFYSSVVADQTQKIDKLFPHFVSVPLAFIREFFAQYVNYFSPKSLFFAGDPDLQRSIPEVSVFYPWMIVLYFIGLYIFFTKKPSNSKKIIALLFFITPITGAFTGQPFHVQRTLAFFLPLTLIMGFGVDYLVVKLKPKLSGVLFSVLFLISLVFLWRGYFILLPQQRAFTWGFEWRQLSEFIKKHPDKQFVIDQPERQKPEEIAYFQLAFYLKTDPKIIQESANPLTLKNYYNDIDFSPVRKFSNIETKPIEWGESEWRDIILVGNTVAISDIEVQRHNLTQVLEIKDKNNVIVLRGFQTNPKTKR